MAITYDESAQLMNDVSFRGRVKVACLKFATYIQAEPDTTPAHPTRLRWAQNTALAPDGIAAQVAPSVVMDDKVQTQGASISDADLQTATETAINKIL
jgi:hypothetical protein